MPRPGSSTPKWSKRCAGKRLVDVKHRVVFGTIEAVNLVLRPLGWQINTAFVEVQPVGRKGSGFRADREVLMNLVTQFSMWGASPPSGMLE